MNVGGHEVGEGHPNFVIAEMSGNHNGDLERALVMIDAISRTGAQAVKFQTYTADTITIDVDGPLFRVSDDHDIWGGKNLYQLYVEAHTPWEWHEELFSRARSRGLLPFSSPFDPSAVELLESLDTACYKVASAEIVDLPLIAEMARTGKPLIISTGMATLSEIDRAMTTARDSGATEVLLLACTSSYPASAADTSLANIQVLRDAFAVPVGLSDHTMGIGVAVASVALGGVAIEKHVTLRRADGGVDSEFSMEPEELATLVAECEAARLASSSTPRFGPRESEEVVLRLRRSLFVVEDVRAGDRVTPDNVRSIRPAGGLAPESREVFGRSFTRDVSKGTPLSWDII